MTHYRTLGQKSGQNFVVVFGRIEDTQVAFEIVWHLCFVHPIFRFWFLVTFGDEVTKILHALCLHFARQNEQDGKKPERKSRN